MTVEYTLLKQRQPESQPDSGTTRPSRPPRIACLLALAHRFESLLQSGEMKDYAELARLGHVTRARVTQIMNLLSLAPEIQKYLLWLPPERRRCLNERNVRGIAREIRWDRQRALFADYTRGGMA